MGTEADKSLRLLHEKFMRDWNATGMSPEEIAAKLTRLNHKRPDGHSYASEDVRSVLSELP